MMRIIIFIAFSISILWHNLYAAESYEWRNDTRFLPQYCKDRAKGLDSAEFSKWRATLGDTYTNIHHYCGGIYAEQMAKSAFDQREKKHWLQAVAGEMRYVSSSCSAKCTLYPELQTRWGWALASDGQPSEAVEHFMLAIRAKPTYVPAYAKLSDLYVDINQPDEARSVLVQGLKAKPGSPMLQRRLRELKTK